MYRAPIRPQRSPAAPQAAGRYPSPSPCWGFPGARSPYGGSGHRGGSPRGCPPCSPGSPVYSPDSHRGYMGASPGGFGGDSRSFDGQRRRRGDGFRRPQSFSPCGTPNLQVEFGVVYSCLEDKMFTARRGKGAFCNGQPLEVSEQKDIQQSIVATEFGSSRAPEAVDRIFCSLKNVLSVPVHGLRGAGTAAINMCLCSGGDG
uniref:Uncharacterized protein n=2 Tax=Amphiprion ocellaris TaxID=80972 RepID=A0A3Q1CA45_AMPOC